MTEHPHAEYVVVARRYRPQSFEDLVGQGMVSSALKNAINTERVGHAYLFTGARGVGKTSTARILAKALNCQNGPTTEPCGTCDICEQIASGEDVDVLEIDGASNRGIDEIRQLRANVGIRPSRSRFKVYIIDEVHMLTKEAFNALLKTLEEPPEHVKFIFCTTEPGKIPITVLSRCQRFDFSPVRNEEIAQRLAYIVQNEGAHAEPEALELLARRAAGSMRDSQSLLEQLLSFVGDKITVDNVHSMFGTAKSDRVQALVEALIQRNANQALVRLGDVLDEGVDAGQLAEQLITSFRDIMAAAVGCDPHLLLFHSPSDHARLQQFGEQWGMESLLAATQILDQSITRMRQSVHSRILLEVALVRIAKLETLDHLTDLISQLGAENSVPASSPKKKVNAESVAPTVETPASPVKPTRSEPKIRIDTAHSNSAPHTPVPQAPESGPEPVGVSMPSDDSITPHTNVDTATEVSSEPSLTSQFQKAASKMQSSPAMAPSPEPEPIAAEPVKPEKTVRTIELSADTVGEVWKEALTIIEDMTADFAGHASRVAISAPNRLVAEFPGVYTSSKAFCEKPERRSQLQDAVSRVAGVDVQIDFTVSAEMGEKKAIAKPSVSAQEQKRRITAHPFVERAIEIFAGEVVRVDSGEND
ncbi:MAG: DNA polymerase III subunit gamma/tau [Planctomycetales bacterium]|nr:DNA polymerase III subunit gamma/tau [Planctomycetales bacterium]